MAGSNYEPPGAAWFIHSFLYWWRCCHQEENAMSLRRIWFLYLKEVAQGPKNFLFALSLVMPLLLTLLFSLIFSSTLTGRTGIGIVDEGASKLTDLTTQNQSVLVRKYDDIATMKKAIEHGSVDVGMVLPTGFDDQLIAGKQTSIDLYIWGESQLKNRTIASTAIVNAMREIAGQKISLNIEQVVLGKGSNIPWEKRLLPLVVLMSIVLAGVLIPASSLVTEKTKHTLVVLSVSPTTMLEVFISKGLLGMTVSIITGLLTLFLNRAFGSQPGLLMLALILGAMLSSTIGVIMGIFVKDINSLFATIKGTGILLYAPAIVYMFPVIPVWIGKIFPTYYIIQPVLEITQNNARFGDIASQLAILVGLILVGSVIIWQLSRKRAETLVAV
jgi:ABC-2 type transport system permease protein